MSLSVFKTNLKSSTYSVKLKILNRLLKGWKNYHFATHKDEHILNYIVHDTKYLMFVVQFCSSRVCAKLEDCL